MVLRFARHPYWIEKRLLACLVLRKARCVTAVSPYTAAALRSFVRPPRGIVVIPNGVTQDTFDLFKGGIATALVNAARASTLLRCLKHISVLQVVNVETGQTLRLDDFESVNSKEWLQIMVRQLRIVPFVRSAQFQVFLLANATNSSFPFRFDAS